MLKVIVKDSLNRITVQMDPNNETLYDAFERSGVGCDTGIIMLNGKVIADDELESKFAEFVSPQADTVVLSVNRKTDNASGIVVAESAVVVRSTVTLSDYKLVQKYEPDALVIKENDVEKFRVAVGKVASINRFGITFQEDREETEGAAVTVLLTDGQSATFALETAGPAALMLDKIESQVADALQLIEANKAAIEEKIVRI